MWLVLIHRTIYCTNCTVQYRDLWQYIVQYALSCNCLLLNPCTVSWLQLLIITIVTPRNKCPRVDFQNYPPLRILVNSCQHNVKMSQTSVVVWLLFCLLLFCKPAQWNGKTEAIWFQLSDFTPLQCFYMKVKLARIYTGCFLATLAALHFTPVSKSVSE